MFGQTFYHSLIRKYVALVGTLFNDIYIERTDSTNTVTKFIRVPITYAPKDKMFARVIQDSGLDRETAVMPLPMISFEIGQMAYDGSRKLNTVTRTVVEDPTTPDKRKYQYNPVPYNIEFKVYVYANHSEDASKIVEQILPYFTPDWTTTVQLVPEVEMIMDIPVILDSINYSDNYDEAYTKRRAIIWSLDLTLKGYLYGPVKSSAIIKFANTNFYIPKRIGDYDLQEEVLTVISGKNVNSTTDFITIKNQPFANGDYLVYANADGNSQITGLTSGSKYYVVQANSTGIKLSTERYGGTVDITYASSNTTSTLRRNSASNTAVAERVTVQPGLTSNNKPTIFGNNQLFVTATANASIENGVVSHLTINEDGYGYIDNPTVTFSASPSGNTATATANVSEYRVVKLNITSGGSGYTSAPTVTISAPDGVTVPFSQIEEDDNYGYVISIYNWEELNGE